MIVVMIGAPFRGENTWETELKIRKAEALALEVAKLGAVPLLMHTMYRYFHGTCTDDFWLEVGKELLVRADVLLLSDDWTFSSGARGEREACKDADKPYFYNIDRLRIWLEEQHDGGQAA